MSRRSSKLLTGVGGVVEALARARLCSIATRTYLTIHTDTISIATITKCVSHKNDSLIDLIDRERIQAYALKAVIVSPASSHSCANLNLSVGVSSISNNNNMRMGNHKDELGRCACEIAR